MNMRERRLRKLLPVSFAAVLGVFLAFASTALNWSTTSTLVVGGALVAVLVTLGTPLMLLDLDRLDDAFQVQVPVEQWKEEIRLNMARDALRTAAFNEGGKIRNEHASLFALPQNPKLHVFNETNLPVLMDELEGARYQLAWVDLLDATSQKRGSIYTPSLPSLLQGGGLADVHEVSYEAEAEPLDVIDVAMPPHESETANCRWALQPILEAGGK